MRAALLVAAALVAIAVAQKNDECAGAAAVRSLPATLKFDNTGLKGSIGRTACTHLYKDAWYRLPSVAAGSVIRLSAFSRDGGAASFPVGYAVYRGCDIRAKHIQCTDERSLVFTAPGGPLWVRIGTTNAEQTGTASISVQLLKPPTPKCENKSPVGPAVGKPSPFSALTAAEIHSVRQWLLARPELSLTPFEEAGLEDNYLMHVTLAPPAKAATLDYLDNNGAEPARTARALVYFNKRNPQVARYFDVGPLPISAATTLVDVTRPEGIRREKWQPDDIEYNAMEAVIVDATTRLSTLMSESYGGYTYGDDCGDLCLSWTDTSPRSTKDGERFTWLWFFAAVEGSYMQPVGLEMRVDMSSADAADWHVNKLVYHYQAFASIDALLDAYNNNAMNKTVLDMADLSWSSFDHRVDATRPPRPLVDVAGPRLYEPGGKRFTIAGDKLSYMGWTMDLSWRYHAGLFVNDVRFLGERILYELGVAEAGSTYSGFSAEQSWSWYTDTAWGMGTSMYSMRQGHDCPHTALMRDVVLDTPYGPYTWPDAVCIFEEPKNYPQRRHYEAGDDGFSTFGSAPAHSLVIRTMPAVYNYDYVIDLIFYLNGLVEVRTAASGYMQAAYVSPSHVSYERGYGTRVHNHVLGSLHDHIFSVKADFDLVGADNTVAISAVKSASVQLPWFDEPIVQRYMEKRYVADEGESGIEFSFDQPSMWYVVNRDKTNRWGNERSYRIWTNSPVKADPYQLTNDFRYQNAAWRKYQLLATRQHDAEQFPTSVFDQASMGEGVTNLETYRANNESLAQVDLVLWLSMGHYHMPVAEDAPVTNVPGTFSSWYFKPANFFDEDPTMDLGEYVRAVPSDNGGVDEIEGLTLMAPCVPSEPLNGRRLAAGRVAV